MNTPKKSADLAGFDAWLMEKIKSLSAEAKSGTLDCFDLAVVSEQVRALDYVRQELRDYVASNQATPRMPPADQAEAEELAKKAVSEYLNACRMTDATNIGNYLMKLASVAGVMMAQAEGADEAFSRLLGTAIFVQKTMPKMPATLRPVH